MNTLAKLTHNPGLIHWRASLRVLGYLNTTKNYCIRYAQQTATEDIIPQGYMRVMHQTLIHVVASQATYSLYLEDLYHGRVGCKHQLHYQAWKLSIWQRVLLLKKRYGKLGYYNSLA